MEKLKQELKALLEKHNAIIAIGQEENDSFMYLQLEIGEKVEVVDSGYKCVAITPDNL